MNPSMTPNHPIPPEAPFTLADADRHANRVDVATVQREAASKAWDAAARFTEDECKMPSPEAFSRARDRYLARESPAPRECVLSDGSVVTVDKGIGGFRRLNRDGFDGSAASWAWATLLNRPTDTGADFDALKSFAERAK